MPQSPPEHDVRLNRPWGPVPAPPPGQSWEGLMAVALAEARCTREIPPTPWAEIPVGALVVAPDGRILSIAHNQPQSLNDPTAHAEVLALRRAGEVLGNYRLGGCVLVVTLEPCLMCVGAMVHARISGVVYGAADMRTGMVQSCLQGLDLPFHNHRVWHYGGVQAEACAELLRTFFMGTRISRPNSTWKETAGD